MSAVVISVLLLAITLSLGFSGFFTRFNILDSEFKERSAALAEGCVDVAMVEAAKEIYSSNKTILVGTITTDDCTIVSSVKDSPIAGQTTIKTQGDTNKAYTNLKVIINNANFSIISWEECATGPCS
ncbi:MAG: hypothetical protein Q7S10_00655 [bacterium]|nr:hypothetical protein [bacterium]